MNIRGKLTIRFLSIVSLIFASASFAIYGFSADYREESFYSRLLSKANNTAKLLIEVDEVDISLLRKLEKDNLASLPKERIKIYNSKNELLFSTDEDSSLTVTMDLIRTIREKGDYRYRDGEFENAGFIFNAEKEQFVVIAGAVDIYGIKRLNNLKTNLLVVNSISFILVFISGWFFSGQALAPIKSVMNQVDEISINNLNLRVDEGNGTDEIARLAKTFNRMLERLEQAFKIQKNFIANASHELRTPLTAITGQLEVDLMKDRTSEEYKHSLRSVLDDMKNLNSISNRLLLLAQTSSENSEMNFLPVRVDEILWQVQSEFKKREPDYKVHISLDERLSDDKMLTVPGSDQLLKSAFSNLADNGCKYSPDKEVFIKIIPGGLKKIIIEFSDNGIGISSEDLKHIFEPFHRGRNAITYRGHGIGLSLVERIIKLHNGSVTVESYKNKGTTFTVTLPVSA